MKDEKGFSLIEVMISIAVLLTVLLGLLYGSVLASKIFLATEQRFRSTLDRWNQSQLFYESLDRDAPKFRPCGACFPIYRNQAISGEGSWEILHAR